MKIDIYLKKEDIAWEDEENIWKKDSYYQLNLNENFCKILKNEKHTNKQDELKNSQIVIFRHKAKPFVVKS